VFPNSWPAIGTTDSQYLEICVKSGRKYRYLIPRGTFLSPEQLEVGLYNGIIKKLQNEFEYKAINNNLKYSNISTGQTDYETSEEPKRRKRSVSDNENDLDEWDVEKIDPSAQIKGKGDLFIDHPDFYARWNENPKNWSVFMTLLQEKIKRERELMSNDTKKIVQSTEKKSRLRFAAEIAGIGSESYSKLINNVDNEEEFFKILRQDVYPGFVKENYDKKMLSEYEERLALLQSVKFTYQKDISRFILNIKNNSIQYVTLSEQIGYVLGYNGETPIKDGEIARYSCDLRGGVSHLCVYINDNLIDKMIVGDSLSSLLQIVAVTGKSGDLVEKHYDNIMYNKVIAREIEEIEIEIRSLDGRPIPFEYGVVIVTLNFKKVLYF
jgi:hypothetical protein